MSLKRKVSVPLASSGTPRFSYKPERLGIDGSLDSDAADAGFAGVGRSGPG